jgi:thiol-disulfide isomerase/thioredoxin
MHLKKKISFLLVCVTTILNVDAQKTNLVERSQWNTTPQELKVGDKMPDVALGNVVNNTTGKTKFSQFRGKLVILDFWNSSCGSCIAAFPKMEQLQKEFSDKIQIFLVNPQETMEQIKAHQNISNFYIPTSLPSIVNAINIEKYFPTKGETGYHIWIDGNGIVRLRGNGHINTYAQKIRALLAGDSISYVSDESVRLGNEKEPLHKLYSKSRFPIKIQYTSSITSFSDEYNYAGAFVINQINKTDQTLRNAILNQDIANLYMYAVMNQKELQLQRASILNGNSIRQILKCEVSSPSNYSKSFLSKEDFTDEWIRKSMFCYEQITPFGIADSDRGQFMLEDLNRFFGNLYGIAGKLEKRKVQCWVIITNSLAGKLASKSEQSKVIRFDQGDKKMVRFTKQKIGQILKEYLSYNVAASFPQNDSLLILDETGFKSEVDIELPEKVESIDHLKTALAPYGMDIVNVERERYFLVIQEKKTSKTEK